jgi:TonB family protein
MLPLWAAGVLALSLRMVWSCRQVNRLRRLAEPAAGDVVALVARLAERMRIARPIRVLVSAVADGPGMLGWIRPMILLPAATLAGLTPEQLEAVLAHELAHIRRHDYLVNIAQMVVETLLFYHPAVWWISSRIRHERELCCDDLAVAVSGDAVLYARALTRLERLRLSPSTQAALVMGSAGGSLSYRIRRLVGAETRHYGPSRWPGVVTLILGVVFLGLNLRSVHAQENRELAQGSYIFELRHGDSAGVTVNLGSAAVLHRRPVEYPEAAVKKGIQGTVVVEATLDATGEVSDARVLSGPAELRRAALESILQWHFAHGSAGGLRQVSIDFNSAAAASKPTERNNQVFVVRGDVTLTTEVVTETNALVSQVEAQVREFEQKLERAQAQVAPINERRDLENNLLELRGRLRELQQERAVTPGAIIESIGMDSLSEDLRKELASHLLLHIGEKLPANLEAAEQALREFDQHLSLQVERLANGRVALRIVAPEQF